MAVLIDLADETTRRILEQARAAGQISLDDLDALIGPGEVAAEDIEDTLAALVEMGIAVIEHVTKEERNRREGEANTLDESVSGVARKAPVMTKRMDNFMPQLRGDLALELSRRFTARRSSNSAPPRRLTQSEIESLRQDAREMQKLVQSRQVKGK
jgi:hypothetical protein